MNRMITVHTSYTDTQFLFQSLHGREALSSLYAFELELLCESNHVTLKALLGQSMTAECRQHPLAPARYLSGVITQVQEKGRSDGTYYRYAVTLHPALWYLSQNRDCRVWQDKNVPDIITTLLREKGIAFDNQLSWDYRYWEYCVQYQESDFDFISRLMEHEGIYYYFTHGLGTHTLVLADAPESHEALAGFETFPCIDAPDGAEAGISCWSVSDSVSPSLCLLDDYDFRHPQASLLQVRQNPASSGEHRPAVFEWPGRYTNNKDGEFYVRIRQQALACTQEKMSGDSVSLGLAPGHRFTLTRAERPEDNRAYLINQAEYFFSESGYHSQDVALAKHHTRFTAHPASLSWRPARHTAWPRTYGPQTAVVVGPEGQTVWTDKYGRVTLKFRWDRQGGQGDEGACWVRVSSAWAGRGFGSLQVPRIGEEVIVDFINGDPDRPIVTGRVFNEGSMPPWELPAAATKMGFMTRTPGGTSDNGSFWVFDDAPGRETFDLHAERDMNMAVENDLMINIDGTRVTRVKGEDNQTVEDGQRIRITKGRQLEVTGGGDNSEVTGDSTYQWHGKRVCIVDDSLTEAWKGGQKTTIASGGQELRIQAGGHIIVVSQGGQRIDIVGDTERKVAGNEHEDTTGSWTKKVGGRIDITASANINIISPTNITFDAPNMKTSTGIKGSSQSFVGEDFSVKGVVQSFTGQQFSVIGELVSITGSTVSASTFTVNNSPFKLKKHDNKTQFVSGSTTSTSNFSSFVSALTTFS